MKKLMLASAMFFAVFTVNAQAPEGFQFGGGIRAGLPIGDFSESHSFGIGAELQGEFGFSSHFSGIITTGYNSFFGKTITILGTTFKNDAVGLIPIIGGFRFYLSDNFFLGGHAGIAILTGNGNSETGFDYQPQVGYNGDNFQIALNYNALSKNSSTLAHVGLTAIFKFGGSSE